MKVIFFTFFVLFGINRSIVDACRSKIEENDNPCKDGELCCYADINSRTGRHVNFRKVASIDHADKRGAGSKKHVCYMRA